MKAATKREQERARDADLLARSKATRMLWPSHSHGTALRTKDGYTHKLPVPKHSGARKLTEAEDNAIARAVRRRQSRRRRQAGKPHSSR